MREGVIESFWSVPSTIGARIAFIHSSPFPKHSGGIDTWLFHVLEKLNEQGREAIVFAPSSSSRAFYDVSRFGNLRIVELSPIQHNEKFYKKLKRFVPSLSFLPVMLMYMRWPLTAWWTIRKYLKKQDTIVALHIIPTMLPVALYKCFGGRNRVLCSVRGTMGTILREMNKPSLAWLNCKIESILLHFVDIVISNGEDTSAYVLKELNKSAIVVPNGVDVRTFSRRGVRLSSTEQIAHIEDLRRLKQQSLPIVLSLGTLRDAKGIRFLVEAAAHLHKEMDSQFCVCLVGKADPTPYRQYAEMLGVAANLLFVGEQREILPFICAADVGVVVSGGGGVSHALLEMMAAGLPVVAWRNLTYSQILTHGLSGHLVQEKNPIALANGIKRIIQDPGYSETLTKNARRIAADHDWSIVLKRFLEVIDCPGSERAAHNRGISCATKASPLQ